MIHRKRQTIPIRWRRSGCVHVGVITLCCWEHHPISTSRCVSRCVRRCKNSPICVAHTLTLDAASAGSDANAQDMIDVDDVASKLAADLGQNFPFFSFRYRTSGQTSKQTKKFVFENVDMIIFVCTQILDSLFIMVGSTITFQLSEKEPTAEASFGETLRMVAD